jgi:hypothetical protein
MDRVIRVLESHEDASQASRDDLAAMTPQQRLDRALDLIARYREARGESHLPFERVLRIVDFAPRGEPAKPDSTSRRVS